MSLADAGSRAELKVRTNSVGWAWKPNRCKDVTEGGMGVGMMSGVTRLHENAVNVVGGTGSNWSTWMIVAMLVCAPGLTTRAGSPASAAARSATVPTIHRPVAGSYVPWLGVADTNDRPAGSWSVTSDVGGGVGAVVGQGDGEGDRVAHVGRGVAHASWPAPGRPAAASRTALAVLLPGLGSNWSECAMRRRVGLRVGAGRRSPVRTSVCGAEAVTVPTVQRPVVLS